jgi:DNA-binding CsgD family transcriptional regulator
MQLIAENLEGSGSWAERWLEIENRARMVLARSLHLLWQSDAASRLLDDTGPLMRKGDQVVGSDRAAHSALVKCLDAAAAGGSAHALLEDGDGVRQFVVEARALAAGPDAPIGVTVREQEDPALPDISAVFGLTWSERQVVSLLIKGLNPTEIAESLNISVLTVRTHIKRVYSKLGIHTKEQLFAKLYMFLL